MTKFIVEFEKTEHTSIEVDAECVKEAEEIANSEICNIGIDEWGCGEIIVTDSYEND